MILKIAIKHYEENVFHSNKRCNIIIYSFIQFGIDKTILIKMFIIKNVKLRGKLY